MREAETRSSALSLAGCSLLALVTLTFTVLIEVRNWKADHYLPRVEAGQWQSDLDQARAELRGAVIHFGLPLYLLCPLTILWAACSSAHSFGHQRAGLPVAMACLAVGILSTILITSLRLVDSLGW